MMYGKRAVTTYTAPSISYFAQVQIRTKSHLSQGCGIYSMSATLTEVSLHARRKTRREDRITQLLMGFRIDPSIEQ